MALACAAADDEARAAPIDVETWERSFPHLGDLFHRIREHAEWDRVGWIRFQTIRLERWSTGRTAVLGDAAHAMSPNLGQGAGCAMMNALGLAVALDEISDVPAALTAWEQRERPLTEHTQRWARIYGAATFWPDGLRSAAFRLTARSGWLNRRYQRTAEHDPTGYSPAPV